MPASASSSAAWMVRSGAASDPSPVSSPAGLTYICRASASGSGDVPEVDPSVVATITTRTTIAPIATAAIATVRRLIVMGVRLM